MRSLISSNILIIQQSSVYLLPSTTGVYSQGQQNSGPTVRARRTWGGHPLKFHTYPTLASIPAHPEPLPFPYEIHTKWVFWKRCCISPDAATLNLSLPKRVSTAWPRDRVVHNGVGYFVNQNFQIQGVPRYHSQETHIYHI